MSAVDHSVCLMPASEAQMLSVKTWFSSTAQIFQWGGPNMVWPIEDAPFLSLLCQPHLHSYYLTNDKQQLLAFGQFYVRLGRHHLGRLAVNPQFRGQGLAKVLIGQLLQLAQQKQSAQGASLFVFDDNQLALQCYLSMGFERTVYPEPMPSGMQHCWYMILA